MCVAALGWRWLSWLKGTNVDCKKNKKQDDNCVSFSFTLISTLSVCSNITTSCCFHLCFSETTVSLYLKYFGLYWKLVQIFLEKKGKRLSGLTYRQKELIMEIFLQCRNTNNCFCVNKQGRLSKPGRWGMFSSAN